MFLLLNMCLCMEKTKKNKKLSKNLRMTKCAKA